MAAESQNLFKPKGIAQAFLVGEDFINKQPVSLILGDNIFYGKMELTRIFSEFDGGARVFGYPVNDPERYGIVEFDCNSQAIGIETTPKSSYRNYLEQILSENL